MQNNKNEDFGYAPFLVWGVIIAALLLAFWEYLPTNCASNTSDKSLIYEQQEDDAYLHDKKLEREGPYENIETWELED